jgi:hypothetical protein
MREQAIVSFIALHFIEGEFDRADWVLEPCEIDELPETQEVIGQHTVLVGQSIFVSHGRFQQTLE